MEGIRTEEENVTYRSKLLKYICKSHWKQSWTAVINEPNYISLRLVCRVFKAHSAALQLSCNYCVSHCNE